MLSSTRYISQTDPTDYELPSGARIQIPTWQSTFPRVEACLLPNKLRRTYTNKPIVNIDGELLFGELAIVRLLEKDGWAALWVDTFHRKFWNDMPHIGEPIELPSHVRALYDKIAKINGTASGCFDVVAWKDERIIWLEYKGPGDKPNKNEAGWIQAAIESGVSTTDLMFVGSSPRLNAR